MLAAVGLGVVAVLVLLLGLLRERRALRDAFPQVAGKIELRGLSGVVRLDRDAHGVPHIEAGPERDAYFVLGFVHAQDRLAQMIWLRRAAQGRLAELLGEELLDADREARLLDLRGSAQRVAAALPPPTQTLLQAYADGVNGWMQRIETGSAAPPLAVERYQVPLEPWLVADSVALLKLYAWGLARSIDAGLVLQDLIEQLGGFGARPFFPPGMGLEMLLHPDDIPRSTRASPPESLRGLPLATGLVGRSLGSSAFVVGGGHTASGLPILAADAHLPTRAPSLFYQAHLAWSGGEVAGGGIPGIPLFWTGHNGRVAWASVHAGAAVVDLYVETLHPTDPDRYHDGREWQALERRDEVIAVRRRAPEPLTVRATRHGPVVDALVGEGREPLSLAWPGALEGDGMTSFLEVARAKDAAELRAALKRHHEPVLTVVYADREGAAGLQLAGWIPRRTLPTGLVPVPGRNRWYDWRSAIPFELLPHVELEDEGGFIVAADARLTDVEHPVRIEWLWRTGARAARIRELLRGAVRRAPLDLRQATALQRDVYSAGNRELIQAVLELAGPVETLGKDARWVADALASWNGVSSVDSRGATVYHVFLDRLQQALLEPRLGPEMLARYLSVPQVDPVHLLRRMLMDTPGEVGGWANRGTLVEVVRESLRSTWVWLSVRLGPNQERWAWGQLHQLRFQPLWQVSGWARGTLGPFPAPGDGTSVAAAEYDPADPFDVRIASTFRLALDLAAPQHALTTLVPGQSGHPGHPQSIDGLSAWRRGKPRLLATSRLVVEETAAAELVLEPVP